METSVFNNSIIQKRKYYRSQLGCILIILCLSLTSLTAYYTEKDANDHQSTQPQLVEPAIEVHTEKRVGLHALTSISATMIAPNAEKYLPVIQLTNTDLVFGWWSGTTINFEIFDEYGNPKGTVSTVTTSGKGPFFSPLNNGGFVVAWSNGNFVDVQIYSSTGSSTGSVISINTENGAYTQIYYSVAGLKGTGGFVVGCSTYFSSTGNAEFAIYESTGAIRKSLTVAGSSLSTDMVFVNALQNGGFILCYLNYEAYLIANIYNSEGTFVVTTGNLPGGFLNDMWWLTTLNDGNVFGTLTDNFENAVMSLMINPTTGAFSTYLTVSTSAYTNLYYWSLASALSDGTALVTWMDNTETLAQSTRVNAGSTALLGSGTSQGTTLAKPDWVFPLGLSNSEYLITFINAAGQAMVSRFTLSDVQIEFQSPNPNTESSVEESVQESAEEETNQENVKESSNTCEYLYQNGHCDSSCPSKNYEVKHSGSQTLCNFLLTLFSEIALLISLISRLLVPATVILAQVLDPSNSAGIYRMQAMNLILYLRYLNQYFPPQLRALFMNGGHSGSSLSFGDPRDVQNSQNYYPAPDMFREYELIGLFLGNAWYILINGGIILGVSGFIELLNPKSGPNENQKLKKVMKFLSGFFLWNYPLTFFLSSVIDISIYSFVEKRSVYFGNSAETTIMYISLAVSSICIIVSLMLMVKIYIQGKNIFQIKSLGLNDEDSLRTLDSIKVLHEDFKDSNVQQLLCLLILGIRGFAFGVVVGLMTSVVFVQILVLILTNLLISGYLLIYRPYKQLIKNIELIFYEIILLSVNSSVLALYFITDGAQSTENANLMDKTQNVGNFIISCNSVLLLTVGAFSVLNILSLIKAKILKIKKEKELSKVVPEPSNRRGNQDVSDQNSARSIIKYTHY